MVWSAKMFPCVRVFAGHFAVLHISKFESCKLGCCENALSTKDLSVLKEWGFKIHVPCEGKDMTDDII